jgi:hypothetical protein
MNLDDIVVTMTLNATVASDTIVVLAIPLVALLTSSPVTWRKERLWNFSVLQRVSIRFQSYYFLMLQKV